MAMTGRRTASEELVGSDRRMDDADSDFLASNDERLLLEWPSSSSPALDTWLQGGMAVTELKLRRLTFK